MGGNEQLLHNLTVLWTTAALIFESPALNRYSITYAECCWGNEGWSIPQTTEGALTSLGIALHLQEMVGINLLWVIR